MDPIPAMKLRILYDTNNSNAVMGSIGEDINATEHLAISADGIAASTNLIDLVEGETLIFANITVNNAGLASKV